MKVSALLFLLMLVACLPSEPADQAVSFATHTAQQETGRGGQMDHRERVGPCLLGGRLDLHCRINIARPRAFSIAQAFY